MKLRSLHINHFGHFADFDLPFTDDGFQLLVGQNEAGKTTLLEFFRCVLFGFPERTPYAFAGTGELGGTASMLLKDGREVELRRRKGRRNTVSVQIDGHDEPLDETGVAHLLGHANRNLFSSVFAFGLSELSLGEDSLKHESLQSALFGGGLGSVFRPEDVLKTLQATADELFKEGGKNPTINKLCSDLKVLAKEIKDKSVRSDDFAARENALRQAEEAAQKLRGEVHELRQQHSHIEKLVNALPSWLKQQALRRERQGLSVPATFPANGRQQFAEINKELTRLNREQKTQADQIAEDEQRLAGITVEDSLLLLKAEIEECNPLIQSVADARRDRPLRQEEYDRLKREVANDLAELCPSWTIDDLQTFKVDAATRDEIERLVQQRREQNDSHTKLTTQREALAQQLSQNADDTAALHDVRDVSALSALLADEAEYTSDIKSLKKLQTELLKLDRAVSARQLKLSPPLPSDVVEPHRLPVPRPEVIAKFHAEFTDIDQRLRAAQQTCDDEAERLAKLKANLASMKSARGAVPSRDDLAANRTRRDEGWRLIRTSLIDGQDHGAEIARWIGDSAPAPAKLLSQYEAAVEQADQTADTLFDNAEAVAKREQLQSQIDAARLAVQTKQAAVSEIERRQQQWTGRWNAAWQLCGFEPLPPDIMERWLADHAALREVVEQREQTAVELDALQARLTAFESRLRSACDDSDHEPQSLLAKIRNVVKDAEAQLKERQNLDKARRRLEKEQTETTAKLKTLDEANSLWRQTWQSLLERLRLPTTWDTDLASRVVERLLTTRAKQATLPNLKSRIEAMSDRINDFGRRVAKLTDRLAGTSPPHDPEVTAQIVNERLAAAIVASERRNSLQQKLDDARRTLNAVTRSLNDARETKQALLASAEAHSDVEFDAVATRAETIAKLDADLSRLAREIEVIRGPEDRNDFEARLNDSDLGILQGRLRDIAADLDNSEKARSQAESQCGECRNQLRLLDGSAVAAECQQSLARQQAKLASEVHRFVPLLFARHLLQEAIRRFERENQPELIGSISQLFRTMTADRYIEIERPSGDQHEIIVRRHDGAERKPEQLSTGTRELLYLAIRLGYVLHYCDQSEPLPIVMDDVLVNFDDTRARATLTALHNVSQKVQVLFFTCHPHLVTLTQSVIPNLQPISLPDRLGNSLHDVN